MRESVGSGKAGVAAAGGVVLAVGCCAAGPLLAALVGSLALGTLVGVGAAVGLVIAVCTVVFLRRRTRATKSDPMP